MTTALAISYLTSRHNVVGSLPELVNTSEYDIVVDSFLRDLPFTGLLLTVYLAEAFDISFRARNELFPRTDGDIREEGVDSEAKIGERSAVLRKVNISNTSKGSMTIVDEVDVDSRQQGKEHLLKDGLESVRVRPSPLRRGEGRPTAVGTM